jgi:hypothetical protein
MADRILLTPGTKVVVVAGKTRKDHEGRIFEIDSHPKNSTKVCCTHRTGSGDSVQQDSYLFPPDVLALFTPNPR